MINIKKLLKNCLKNNDLLNSKTLCCMIYNPGYSINQPSQIY